MANEKKKTTNKPSVKSNKQVTQQKKTEELAIVDDLPLDEQTSLIAENIVKEKDVYKVKDLTTLFNLNQRKKNVLRLMKFNGLLDTISDQMLERFEKKAGEFSNSDLLNYMQVIQSAIDRAQKSIDLVSETPSIQLNQNNLTVNVGDGFDRESKERIADAVKAILARVSTIKEESDPPIIIDAIKDDGQSDGENDSGNEDDTNE